MFRCSLVWTAEFSRPDSVRLVTSLPHLTTSTYTTQAAYQLSQSITQDGRGKCQEKRSDVEEKRREKRKAEDEEPKEEGRAGQGLSVEKTEMKGNCHAPVLAQEHLSREEHAKCAGHVLTTPPHFIHTLTHTSTQEEADAPPLERHHLFDSMPFKMLLVVSHMQGKVRLMRKKHMGVQRRNH